MRQIAAYALLVLGGKPAPAPEEVAQVIREAGADPEMEKCIALCAALEGKPFNELVETGLQTLRAMGLAAQEKMAVHKEKPSENLRNEGWDEYGCCGICSSYNLAGLFCGEDDDY